MLFVSIVILLHKILRSFVNMFMYSVKSRIFCYCVCFSVNRMMHINFVLVAARNHYYALAFVSIHFS